MPSEPIHIEHLFATMLTVDRPSPAAIGSERLTAAIDGVTPGSPRPLWSDAAGAMQDDVAAALVAHVRRLATSSTADARGRPSPAWHVEASAHAYADAAQPEVPARFDAFWSALFVADDGYRAGDETGGELVLIDPRLPAPMMEAPGLRLVLAEGRQASAYAPELLLRPATGQVLLYPAWFRVQQRARPSGRLRKVVHLSLVAPAD